MPAKYDLHLEVYPGDHVRVMEFLSGFTVADPPANVRLTIKEAVTQIDAKAPISKLATTTVTANGGILAPQTAILTLAAPVGKGATEIVLTTIPMTPGAVSGTVVPLAFYAGTRLTFSGGLVVTLSADVRENLTLPVLPTSLAAQGGETASHLHAAFFFLLLPTETAIIPVTTGPDDPASWLHDMPFMTAGGIRTTAFRGRVFARYQQITSTN